MRARLLIVALAAAGVFTWASAQTTSGPKSPVPSSTERTDPPQQPASQARMNNIVVPGPRPMYEGPSLTVEGALGTLEAEELTVKREGEPDAIVEVDDQTAYFDAGEAVTRTELPPGENVRVEYVLEGHERRALRVEVRPEAAEAAP